MNKTNKFVTKTIEIFRKNGIEINDNRLSSGFGLDDNCAEECVLILGLNPAGNENDAKNARNNRDKPYLFSLETSNYHDLTYNTYFRPIYEFVNQVLEEGGKWSWCNKSREFIKKTFDDDPIILKEFDKNKDKRYTIHVGDMFYYHQTNSKLLTDKLNGNERYSMALEILNDHIDYLVGHNRKIKFVYINNATVSKWLTNESHETFQLINNIPVFYGGMLSGQRSMDNFSKERLIQEIKTYFKKAKE